MDYDENYYEWTEEISPYEDLAFEDYEEVELPFYRYIISDIENTMAYLYRHGTTLNQWIEYEILDKSPKIWTNDNYKGWMYPFVPPAA